jgi:hypothetical protein
MIHMGMIYFRLYLVLSLLQHVSSDLPDQHPSEDMLNNLSGVYADAKHLIYLKWSESSQVSCRLDHCPYFREDYDSIRDYTQTDISNVSMMHGISFRLGSEADCMSICQSLSPQQHKHSDTLVLFTTCNHLDMSARSLNTLKSAPDSFDLVIVDDHSIDGTPEILLKKVR